MTRVSKNSLVLDGSEVKYRLQAERLQSKTPVHVDWVRFTVIRRNAPLMSAENLFPCPFISDRKEPEYLAWAEKERNSWETRNWRAQWMEVLRDLPDEDYDASTQALELAQAAAQALGADYAVNHEIKKGHDFYRFRLCIERNGVECGWVGFLASGNSPRQQAQSSTIHCNIFGAGCTFADAGWRERLAGVVTEYNGTITRCDLALDFFDGYPGGILAICDDYNNGLCNASGKRLKVNFVGDWSAHSKGARSIYFGSREAGKETNAYEKGDQLFGVDAGSPWLRVELRYGNKFRVLPVDMLLHPADFFAGASDWHASALSKQTEKVTPEIVRCAGRLALETLKAECYRNIRWLFNVAVPSLANAFDALDFDQFKSLLVAPKKPGRLDKFSKSELHQGMRDAFGYFSSQPEGPPTFVMA